MKNIYFCILFVCSAHLGCAFVENSFRNIFRSYKFFSETFIRMFHHNITYITIYYAHMQKVTKKKTTFCREHARRFIFAEKTHRKGRHSVRIRNSICWFYKLNASKQCCHQFIIGSKGLRLNINDRTLTNALNYGPN